MGVSLFFELCDSPGQFGQACRDTSGFFLSCHPGAYRETLQQQSRQSSGRRMVDRSRGEHIRASIILSSGLAHCTANRVLIVSCFFSALDDESPSKLWKGQGVAKDQGILFFQEHSHAHWPSG